MGAAGRDRGRVGAPARAGPRAPSGRRRAGDPRGQRRGRGRDHHAGAGPARAAHGPDRVIVGEVRGGEVLEMLLAMSQGNDGSLCTLHADSSAAALTKIATYALMARERMPVEATNLLIAQSVGLVVHLARRSDGSPRRVVGPGGHRRRRAGWSAATRCSRRGRRPRPTGACLHDPDVGPPGGQRARPGHGPRGGAARGGVDMTTLVAALLGAVVGLGLLLVVAGVRGVPVTLVVPRPRRGGGGSSTSTAAWAWRSPRPSRSTP